MKAITNAEWVEKFRQYLQRRFPGRSTAKHYESDMKCFLEKCGKPLLAVQMADVDKFVDEQRQQGKAAATIKRRAAALKTFYDFVAEETGEKKRANPVSVKRHGGKQPQHLPRDLSDEEVERLLGVVEEKRDRAMVVIMLYGGLRVEEVVNLKRGDIQGPREAEAAVRLRVLGKGRKERVVYLSPAIYQIVDAYLAGRPVSGADETLFVNQRGQPLSIAGVQWVMRVYAQASGVKVTCHRLRHTCARWLAEGEMPLLSLARFLGHSSLASTQRYLDGANPVVRRHYEAAMQPAVPPPSPALPAARDHQAPPTMTTATVVRPTPPTFTPPAWLAEWPAWLRDSCLTWLKQRWFNWKPSRRQQHACTLLRQLRLFWRWQLAQRAFTGWSDLTLGDIEAFIQAELARGLKAKTVTAILDPVYSLLHYLLDTGQLHTIPPRPLMALPDPLPRHLLPDELLALESYVKQNAGNTTQLPWLTVALYYVLAHAGLRIGELLDLQIQDLDLPHRRLLIREGKNRRDRVVYLTQTAAQALGLYLPTVPHAPGDLVFSLHHQPLTYHQAWQRLRALAAAAGLAHLSPLRLRHTFATTLLNNGMTIDALRHLMGHNHLSTTLIYARLADSTVENQYQAAMARVSI
jgi:site-specific recombinase XerD